MSACFLSRGSSNRFYSEIDEEFATCCPRINRLLLKAHKEAHTTLKSKGMMQCIRHRNKNLGQRCADIWRWRHWSHFMNIRMDIRCIFSHVHPLWSCFYEGCQLKDAHRFVTGSCWCVLSHSVFCLKLFFVLLFSCSSWVKVIFFFLCLTVLFVCKSSLHNYSFKATGWSLCSSVCVLLSLLETSHNYTSKRFLDIWGGRGLPSGSHSP